MSNNPLLELRKTKLAVRSASPTAVKADAPALQPASLAQPVSKAALVPSARYTTVQLTSDYDRLILSLKTTLMATGKNAPTDSVLLRAGLRAIETLSAQQLLVVVEKVQGEDRRKKA